jgi:hypothetical protein
LSSLLNVAFRFLSLWKEEFANGFFRFFVKPANTKEGDGWFLCTTYVSVGLQLASSDHGIPQDPTDKSGLFWSDEGAFPRRL